MTAVEQHIPANTVVEIRTTNGGVATVTLSARYIPGYAAEITGWSHMLGAERILSIEPARQAA